MNWLQGFWFVTAIPELIRIFSPTYLGRSVALADRYVSAGYQYAIILGLGIFGVFFATYRTWREADREIGLRATRIHFMVSDSGLERKIFVGVRLFNSGRPSVATDWKLAAGREVIGSAERRFQCAGVHIDPQAIAIEEGGHAFGNLMFQTRLTETEINRRKWRLTFQDAARRTLRADEKRP
jgi:hypothetical protein